MSFSYCIYVLTEKIASLVVYLLGLRCRLPGGCCQGDEQSLQDSSYVNNGALFGDEEVHGGQDEEAVEHQPEHHGHSVEAQLLSHGRWVAHL